MNLSDLNTQEAVWQRVMGREGASFYAMAAREEAICTQCRGLYRQGVRKKTMERLYRQARARQRAVISMAKQAGEAARASAEPSRSPALGALLELLGAAAWAYDPDHPIYGPLFSQLRAECAQGQRLILAPDRH